MWRPCYATWHLRGKRLRAEIPLIPTIFQQTKLGLSRASFSSLCLNGSPSSTARERENASILLRIRHTKERRYVHALFCMGICLALANTCFSGVARCDWEASPSIVHAKNIRNRFITPLVFRARSIQSYPRYRLFGRIIFVDNISVSTGVGGSQIFIVSL